MSNGNPVLNHGAPVALGAFWTWTPELWCRAIGHITGPDLDGKRWGHTGALFMFESGHVFYYEALLGKGCVGPQPVYHLDEWAAKNPKRRCEKGWFTGNVDVAAAYKEALDLQRFAVYSGWQLIQAWAHERIGWHVPKNETKLFCSEYLARIAAAGGVDLTDAKHERPDEVTPVSARIRYQKLVATV